MPAGFAVSSPIVIEAGHLEATGTVFAAADAKAPTKENNAATKVICSAMLGGKEVSKAAVNTLGTVASGASRRSGVALVAMPRTRRATRPASQCRRRCRS